ncbi:MAG: PAS domain S-box protein [Alphaproteobacteria bacterium]|nr:PAS domain S-box protein [Alphaproteobacteria bacterium]
MPVSVAASVLPDDAVAGGVLTWMRALGALSVAFSAVALGITALLVFHASNNTLLRPVAVVAATFALGAGVASVVAKQMHTLLSRRIDLMSQAIESSPGAHLILSPDDHAVYANGACHRFFPGIGKAPLAALGARVGDVDLRRLKQDALRVGQSRGVLAVPNAAGETQWFNLAVVPLAARQGYTLWSFEDVTARHAVEQMLRDERMKLADFLDNAPIGFYSVDETGRFLFVNEALAQWLGRGAQELVDSGDRLGDFLDEAPPFGAPPHAPFEGGETRGEVALRSADGRRIHALISQSVVRTGDHLRTRSVVRDLTPERQWEEQLRVSRQRFRRFFANAPVGIALMDGEGRIEEANDALCRWVALSPGEVIGRPLLEFLKPEDQDAAFGQLRAASEGRIAPGPVEVRLVGAGNKSAQIFISRLGDEAAETGASGGFILHFIDQTEQKSLQAQFAQSQKMQAVGQLAGGVAHDFNNLLTAMIGFCDLLLVRFRPNDATYGDIMQIKQNANRAANLVRQLLAFSRQQALQPRVLSVKYALAELSNLLRRLIGENIELKVVHDPKLWLVKVDQGQIEQVIINLAVNARDAMSEGGTLSIRTANIASDSETRRGHEIMPPGDYVLIEVKDTGQGIPKDIQNRIFEPFFSTKELGSGTGLGLSTVYGIVKQTGGFVFVDSELGKGATFSIFLPRHDGVAPPPPRPETGETAVRDLTGAGTVLLVEDEDPVRLFSARALTNSGYKVLEAKSGEAALEIMARGVKIDLLVTDVVMPKMDGPGLVAKLRQRHPDLKVIFISGYTEDSFRKRLGDERDIHFLPKPFSLKQLAGKVKEVLAEPVA